MRAMSSAPRQGPVKAIDVTPGPGLGHLHEYMSI